MKGQREKSRVCFRYQEKHFYSHIFYKARGKAIFSRFLEGLRGAFERGRRNNEILQKSKKEGKISKLVKSVIEKRIVEKKALDENKKQNRQTNNNIIMPNPTIKQTTLL